MSEQQENDALAALLEGITANSLPVVIAYLESVILDGNPGICPHCKEQVELPASHNTRVAAVRAWKELVLDKVKGNKRDRTPQEKGLDYKTALENLSRVRQEKEAAGIKSGKVVLLPETVPVKPKRGRPGKKLAEFRAKMGHK